MDAITAMHGTAARRRREVAVADGPATLDELMDKGLDARKALDSLRPVFEETFRVSKAALASEMAALAARITAAQPSDASGSSAKSAATAPGRPPVPAAGRSASDADEGSTPEDRVPKGLLARTVDEVVAAHPGATSAQVVRLVQQVDARLAADTIPAQLRRRLRDRRYRREGDRWFLVTGADQEGSAGLPDKQNPANKAKPPGETSSGGSEEVPRR